MSTYNGDYTKARQERLDADTSALTDLTSGSLWDRVNTMQFEIDQLRTDVAELNARLHERTQGFLDREAREILKGQR